jgi:hypothetical protein
MDEEHVVLIPNGILFGHKEVDRTENTILREVSQAPKAK